MNWSLVTGADFRRSMDWAKTQPNRVSEHIKKLMTPTKMEIQRVIGEIENEHGPIKFRDPDEITLKKEQVRILIEGLRRYAVFNYPSDVGDRL